MLSTWLKKPNREQPTPSWNILITALSESVGITQAEKIAQTFVCKHQ